jgi:hypothetical protein
MAQVFTQKTSVGLEHSLHEKQRHDLLHAIASVGQRDVAELTDMNDSERSKWLIWNLHENLEVIRLMEPTLQARITSTQFTVQDGMQGMGEGGVEKRLDLSCNWILQLTYPGYQDEISHAVGDGWINLVIAAHAPLYPVLQQGQKGYLDADHSLYPNQLFLEGWISDGLWQEIRSHICNSNPTCRTDVVLLDNVLFPVKQGFDFVCGPPGAIGVTNMEFRAYSHPTERRVSRRSEPRQRS